MKYFYTAATFVLFIFFVSCKSEADNKEQIAAPSVSPITTNPVFPAGNDTAGGVNAGVMLNPKHGQPGHNCAIAEGAPLNTPVTNIQPTVSAIPTTSSPISTNTNVDFQKILPQVNTPTASAGMNPKHGEPGHRCDIAVGAPLPKQ